MNDAQRARLATLRDRYSERGMDVHGFDGDDNLLHVIVYGRITGAEIEVHTIALDGQLDVEARADSVSPNDVVHGGQPERR
jgi:limonene-1,2-epoxide hydrolase